jgi:hypothetical protein
MSDWEPPDDAETRRAMAYAWDRCVEWFAIQGPLRDTPRIPGWMLSNAQEENPYEEWNSPEALAERAPE